ncbi:MAG: hypothetical protein ACYCXK_11115, partial [Candidatus Humimicrobiaceae bacterium]
VAVFLILRMGNNASPAQTTVNVNNPEMFSEENNPSATSSTVRLSQEEEYDRLAQDKNFVSVFNNFSYPDSVIKDAKLVEEDGSMFYIVLETKDNFDKVDNFYKSKKIQSIWSRSEIFEEASQQIEESFLSSDTNDSQTTMEESKYFKYSFSSENKDQLLNILARSYSQEVTQVMIIYWKLSN